LPFYTLLIATKSTKKELNPLSLLDCWSETVVRLEAILEIAPNSAELHSDLCKLCDTLGKTIPSDDASPPIPPQRLRARVGSAGIESFLTQGKRHIEDLRKALPGVQKDFYSFKSILDFGCGAGRQIRWFHDHPSSCKVYGADIDEESIAWAQTYMRFADFLVNDLLPPLPYKTNMFQLVIGVSVFTHLNEESQFLWLKELQRVTVDNGILLLTTHGEQRFDHFRQDAENTESPLLTRSLPNEGFLFFPYKQETVLTSKYGDGSGIAFHSHEYIKEKWALYFTVIDIIDSGLEAWQDIVVLKK
jgi:SAM-dependent methyltransferase